MIGGKINATGMTGFVNEKRTRSQWGQWRRERRRERERGVRTCLSARCVNASIRRAACLRLSVCVFAFSSTPSLRDTKPLPSLSSLREGASEAERNSPGRWPGLSAPSQTGRRAGGWWWCTTVLTRWRGHPGNHVEDHTHTHITCPIHTLT